MLQIKVLQNKKEFEESSKKKQEKKSPRAELQDKMTILFTKKYMKICLYTAKCIQEGDVKHVFFFYLALQNHHKDF